MTEPRRISSDLSDVDMEVILLEPLRIGRMELVDRSNDDFESADSDNDDEEDDDDDASSSSGGGSDGDGTREAGSDDDSSDDDDETNQVDWAERREAEHDFDDGDSFPSERDLFRLSNQYLMNECLARTDDAAVYAAHDRTTREPVIVKVVRQRHVGRQPREVSVMTALQATGRIPRLWGWHPLPETRCVAVVSQMLRSDKLDECVFRRPDRILPFMRQLLDIIAKVHASGLIHRDVKTSNLVWHDAAQHLSLIDFDVAVFYTSAEETPLRDFIGTDGWIAPEVYASSSASLASSGKTSMSYNEKVDVYAAGVVMAQLVFGVEEADVSADRKDRRSAAGFRRRIKEQRAKRQARGETVTHDADLLLALLDVDPTKRPSAQEALAMPFFSNS